MSSTVHRLLGQGRITPPPWLDSNLMLEVTGGSRSYGIHREDSDYDKYGICMPPKAYVFPSMHGLIPGFDEVPAFKHWEQHGITDQDGKRQYEFTVYSLVRFFQLAEENNPNIIDILFVHETDVTHCTPVGRMLLDNRNLFLSKLCWKKFRSYASDQFHKVKERKPEGKRKELVEKFGYDVKFAANVIRLMNEVEQIITEKTLVLTRGNEEAKQIRRGEWPLERLEKEFVARKEALETQFAKCDLPERPDHEKLKQLLMDCMESHYGSLTKVIVRPDATVRALRDIDAILNKVRCVYE